MTSTLTTPKAWTPIGWKLVPIKASDEQADKGQYVNSEWLNDNAPLGERMYRSLAIAVYEAMVADAPEPPTEIASALNTALARAVSEWRPTLQAALDRIDAADKECPVRQSKRSVEKCPRCFAAVSDGCGLNVRALHSLEADIRSLLVPPPPETGGR